MKSGPTLTTLPTATLVAAPPQGDNVLKLPPSRPKINRPPPRHINPVNPLEDDNKGALPKRTSGTAPKHRQWDFKFALGLIALVVIVNMMIALAFGTKNDSSAKIASDSSAVAAATQPSKKTGADVPLNNARPITSIVQPPVTAAKPVQSVSAPVAPVSALPAATLPPQPMKYVEAAAPAAPITPPTPTVAVTPQAKRPGVDFPVAVAGAPVVPTTKPEVVTPSPAIQLEAAAPAITAPAAPVTQVTSAPIAAIPAAPAQPVATATAPVKRPGVDYPVAVNAEADVRTYINLAPSVKQQQAQTVAAQAKYSPAESTIPAQTPPPATQIPVEKAPAQVNTAIPTRPQSDKEKAHLLKIINQY